MKGRVADLVVLSLMVVCTIGAPMTVDLEELLRQGLKRGSPNNDENVIGGNPCVDFPDHPFPCKSTSQCLPFRYICDKNLDCLDGSDEDEEMCTASLRPPIEEIAKFLENQQKWIMPSLFPGKRIKEVAHAIAISPNLKEFKKYLGYSKKEYKNFIYALKAVDDNHAESFEAIGMPPGDWQEVKYIFENLLENGFGI